MKAIFGKGPRWWQRGQLAVCLMGLLCAGAFTQAAEAAEAANAPEDPALQAMIRMLGEARETQLQLDILSGMNAALQGKRGLPMPAGWDAAEARLGASAYPQVRLHAQTLGLAFGSKKAFAQLQALARDAAADAALRAAALEALLATREESLPALLRELLADRALRAPAIRGLARFDTPGTAEAILKAYSGLDAAAKRDALNTLASRATYAKPLLDAAAAGAVAKAELTADLIRQLRNLKDPGVDAGLVKVWGAFREVAADKKQEIERYVKIYRAGGSTPGDGPRGRAVFALVCQQCHMLFDTGGAVGPDITGSNRADLAYILETILDPNAVIPNEYRSSTLTTKDDRVLTGIIKKQDASAVTIATANETLVLPRAEIESVRESEISMMPEGLLAGLADQEFRDLIYYLSRPGQVPLPAPAP